VNCVPISANVLPATAAVGDAAVTTAAAATAAAATAAVMLACTEARLSEVPVTFRKACAATVVMAAGGYPEVISHNESRLAKCVKVARCSCRTTRVRSRCSCEPRRAQARSPVLTR
jgi:phosphoribosylamine-glycine ligase